MPRPIFISHSHKDRDAAQAVCRAIEAAGLDCWIAPRDIAPGEDWGESIVGAIDGAAAMVLVLSAYSGASPQVRREVELAVSRGRPLIPFQIEDAKPSRAIEYFINAVQRLDAFPPPLESHLPRLTEAVRRLVHEPPRGSADEKQSVAAEPSRARLSNLPTQLDDCLGREAELLELDGMLTRNRLVTLVGTGGVGKTRLALELATQMSDRFTDGAWLVELAPLRDPRLVPETIAGIFGLPPSSSGAAADLVCGFLRDKELMLVLDNCEHLLEAVASIAERLLRAC
ncbi:MAG TPA: TIR domain-containing protein, partial [Stellaceae bacterium]|nr:TIR domain-containing protein [Stellaceae bacterium]